MCLHRPVRVISLAAAFCTDCSQWHKCRWCRIARNRLVEAYDLDLGVKTKFWGPGVGCGGSQPWPCNQWLRLQHWRSQESDFLLTIRHSQLATALKHQPRDNQSHTSNNTSDFNIRHMTHNVAVYVKRWQAVSRLVWAGRKSLFVMHWLHCTSRQVAVDFVVSIPGRYIGPTHTGMVGVRFRRWPKWRDFYGGQQSSATMLHRWHYFVSMCTAADDRLFTQVTCNTQHLLHDLLPPQREQHYYLRERPHSYQLPDRASTLKDKNLLVRMLYRDIGCSQRCQQWH